MMTRLPLAFLAALTIAAVDSHAQLPTVSHANRPKPAFTMADFKAQTPRNKDGAFVMEVPQILHTANSAEVQAILAGQPVETIGQLTRDPAAGGAIHFRVSRTQLHCCAAHAQDCAVLLEFAGPPPTLKDAVWVKISGTIAYRREGEKTLAVIRVATLHETPKPAVPLLQ